MRNVHDIIDGLDEANVKVMRVKTFQWATKPELVAVKPYLNH